MKKVITAILIIVASNLFLSFRTIWEPNFVLNDVEFEGHQWVLMHVATDDMTLNGDSVSIITDVELLKANKDSLYIIGHPNCVNSTPEFQFVIYRNGHHFRTKSYCYDEQVELGSLKGKFKKAVKKTPLFTNKQFYQSALDSLKLEENVMILITFEKKDEYMIKYFELID
jgi:hypothetical protein